MGLTKYKAKRDFKQTSEPAGKKKAKSSKLIFVVQKHHASHLHYDFRLEMEGVLKSWAVPKGPSLNPDDKRLAMMVEDHPYDYKDFEGSIPAGNYGAGNVIVWDNGTYHSWENDGNDEKTLLAGLKKGHITFILEGKKLKGEFALIKLRGKQESAWLLVKKNDEFASNEDVLKKNRSVLSKLTIEGMDKENPRKPSKELAREAARKELRKEKKPEETTKAKPKAAKAVARAKSGKDSENEVKVGKVSLKLTNQSKIYWPDEGITKGELVNYYAEIAPVMLPYLKDRPQSLNRFPNGINAPSFYQKDFDTSKTPDWLTTKKIYSTSNKEYIDYLVCNDKATLMYMANLGCIEINPWNSRVKSLDEPDWIVIDLDPETIAFAEVVRTAQMVRKVCDELELECLCKTSGATGLHIFIPLAAKYKYEVARNFAHLIAQRVNELLPDITSLVRQPKQRQNKVYLDFLQNSKGQTLAAPYSVRPKPGATVSTPLDWKEVNSRLDPSRFTIKTIFKRLDKTGDIWKAVLGKGADIKKVIAKLEKG